MLSFGSPAMQKPWGRRRGEGGTKRGRGRTREQEKAREGQEGVILSMLSSFPLLFL